MVMILVASGDIGDDRGFNGVNIGVAGGGG